MRGVLDANHVAARVVRVTQVLNHPRVAKEGGRGAAFGGRSRGANAREAERQRIVRIRGGGAVSINDLRATPLRVVGNLPNERSARSRAAERHLDRIEQPRFVEPWKMHASVRGRRADGAAGRVDLLGARVAPAVRGGLGAPVHRRGVPAQEVAACLHRVALEVVGDHGRDASAVVMGIGLSAVVLRVAAALAVHRALGEPLDAILGHPQAGRPSGHVVGDAPHVTAAVPRANRLSYRVGEGEPLARFHARGAERLAEHAVVHALDDAALRVDDGAHVALDVDLGALRKDLLAAMVGVAGAIHAVLCVNEERATERVEVGHARGVGVHTRLSRRGGLVRAQRAAFALCEPRGVSRAVVGEVAREGGPYVPIGARIAGLVAAWRGGVARVVGGRAPGPEHHFVVRVVRVQRRDRPPDRVVEQDRRDALRGELVLRLEEVRRAEEGLVLSYREPLCIVHGSSGAEPTRCRRCDGRIACRVSHERPRPRVPAREHTLVAPLRCLARLCFDLGLRLPSEAIGVNQRHAHPARRPRRERVKVRLPRERSGEHRLSRSREPTRIVDKT